jgi:hypothetical protein
MHTKTNTTLESLSRINMTEGRMVQRRRQRHEYTKRIAIHAFFYIVAGLLPQIAGRFLASRESNAYSRRSQILYTVLRPCQGLLNFIVFFGQKVSDVRQIDPSLNRRRAGMIVLRCREKPHFQFSGISIVDLNDQIRRINVEASVEFDDDENDEAVVGVGSIRSNPSVLPLSMEVDTPVSFGRVSSSLDQNLTVDRLQVSAALHPLTCANDIDREADSKTRQFSPSNLISTSSLATPSIEPVMEISLSGSNNFQSDDDEEGNTAGEEGKNYYSRYRIKQ